MVSDGERRFLAQQRIAHLATADRRAVPHVVPVCFAIFERTLYITIDEKPKRRPGATLKRLRNIAENPAVAVIVDRYDEDWARLSWAPCRLQNTPSSPFASNARQAGVTYRWARQASHIPFEFDAELCRGSRYAPLPLLGVGIVRMRRRYW